MEGKGEPRGQPPAGWYPDPQNAQNHRYWDGNQWTEHVQAVPTATPSQPAAPSNQHGFVAWWRNHWSGPVIGAVAFLIGVGIGAAGGSSSSTTTVQHTTTSTAAGGVKTQTQVRAQTQTVTVKAPTPAPPSSTSNSGSSGTGGKHYSGSGSSSLGTITVSAPSTLRWTDTGGGVAHSFAILGTTSDYSNTISVSSNATSGTSQVSPGTYHDVQVIGDDSWTITISPG